jgi:predicted DNA repair protein MutK
MLSCKARHHQRMGKGERRVSSGLLALLDDVAAIAKLAAASLDDAAAQAAKAGSKAMTKAAGIVIDDAAVTPRYVVGFAASRELPIVGKIALGSLKNKMLILLPAALLMSYFAPWLITPLLMLGGVYLALEGYEKVADLVRPHGHGHGDADGDGIGDDEEALDPLELENQKVQSAIRTDFILSAEIMAISLSTVAAATIWMQAGVLAVVGIGMTVLVYGAVAIIVKADDVGAAMARNKVAIIAAIGRGIVLGMPVFLRVLTYIGMVAMLWVGGGILTHGLHELGVHGPEDAIKAASASVSSLAPFAQGFVGWLTGASICAVIGLGVGGVTAPLVHHILLPLASRLRAGSKPQ